MQVSQFTPAPSNGPIILSAVVARLDAIQRNGTLSELLQAHAIESREAGLPSYRDWHSENDLKSKELARAVEQLFGLPASQTQSAISQQLNPHPRVALALDLIEHYQPSSRLPTAEDDAQWNPHTGGPAIEKWEAEQRQIDLARAIRTAKPQRKEMAW